MTDAMALKPFRIKIQTRVVRIEEHFKDRYVRGVGRDAVFEKISLGFFLHLQGSWESLFVGYEMPDIRIGDVVSVTVEKP